MLTSVNTLFDQIDIHDNVSSLFYVFSFSTLSWQDFNTNLLTPGIIVTQIEQILPLHMYTGTGKPFAF